MNQNRSMLHEHLRPNPFALLLLVSISLGAVLADADDNPSRRIDEPIWSAVRSGNLQRIMALADGVDPTPVANLRAGVLLCPNAQAVEFLNAKWKLGISDLQIAVIHGDDARIRNTLAALPADSLGARLAKDSGEGPPLLHLAALHDQHDVIKELIQFGSVINQSSRSYGTPLGIAAKYGNESSIAALLHLKADVNVTADGYTPLMQACCHRRPKAARMLLEAGANPSLARHDGQQALHLAAKFGSAHCAKLLLEYGADPTAIAYGSDTPLMYAERNEHEAVVRVLTDAIDPTARRIPNDQRIVDYLSRSDLCVAGKIISYPLAMSDEQYVVNYSCDAHITDVLYGDLHEKSVRVNIVRFERNEEDRLPYVRNDGRCILFLKRMPDGTYPIWRSIDMRFGTEPHSQRLLEAIQRTVNTLSDAPDETEVGSRRSSNTLGNDRPVSKQRGGSDSDHEQGCRS